MNDEKKHRIRVILKVISTITCVLLIGYSCDTRQQIVTIVPKKYCMRECIKESFGMFRNNGRQWDTSSSSMNGITETKILEKVKKQCNDFISDSLCCDAIGNYNVGYRFSRYKLCGDIKNDR